MDPWGTPSSSLSLPFIPVSGQLMAVLLLQMFALSTEKLKCGMNCYEVLFLWTGKVRAIWRPGPKFAGRRDRAVWNTQNRTVGAPNVMANVVFVSLARQRQRFWVPG
jgi:hypothetical protein